MRARFGGFGAAIDAASATKASISENAARVEPPLEPDRRRRLRAHRLPAQRPGDVTREHLDAVGELHQPPQRAEQPLGALPRPDGEVRPRRVADEERVAGEHEPRLVAARPVGDDEAAVLGPVAGRVDDAKRDPADLQLVAVLRAGRAGSRRRPRDGCCTGSAVLEREAAVPRDVVGVRVRLDHADEPHPLPLGLGEQRLDRVRRVDHDGDPGLLVTDQVARAPEIVVQNCWKITARR